jgi:hypothetical protein
MGFELYVSVKFKKRIFLLNPNKLIPQNDFQTFSIFLRGPVNTPTPVPVGVLEVFGDEGVRA